MNREEFEALKMRVQAIETKMLGKESGQSGPSGPYIVDSYKGKEVSKEESSKKDPYKNFSIGASSPTPSLPTPTVVAPRGARLPEGWTLGPIGLNYARSKGLSEADAYHEAEKFKSHFLSASGKNAIKRDWIQAWQVWVLNALHKYGIRPTLHSPTNSLSILNEEKRAELAAKYSKKGDQ